MRALHDLLRVKEAELQRLETEVQALRIVLNLCSREQSERQSASTDSGEITQPEMVRIVLAEKGQAMKLSEIIAAVHEKFGREIKENNLSSLLYRNLKSKRVVFRKEAQPNTFGLAEWPASTDHPSYRQAGLLDNGIGVQS